MRNLLVVTQRLDPVGGLERAAISLAQAVSRSGDVEVTIAVLQGPINSEVISDLESCETITGPKAWKRVRQAMTTTRPQPTIVCGLWAAALASLVGPTKNPAIVYWEHTLLEARLTNDLRTKRVARFSQPVRRSANQTVAVSNAVRNALIQQSPDASSHDPSENGSVIPNLMALRERPRQARPSGPIDGQQHHLVAVGALRPIKNHTLLLTSLARLGGDYRLTIAGSGPENERLKQQAAALGISDQVTLAGQVASPEQLLESADVLVHPSLSETFGMSLIEAGMADVPVATLDVAAIDEVVPSLVAGVRAAEPTSSAFRQAIAEALAISPGDQQFKMARAARRSRLDPDAILRQWQAVFDRLPTGSAKRPAVSNDMPASPAAATTKRDDRVTAIIPTIGRPSLHNAVASALNQLGVDLRVTIVVDRAPTADGIVPGLGLAISKDHRVSVHWTGGGKGGAHARQLGTEAATTPWVAYLDDDDVWLDNKLIKQLSAANAEPAPDRCVVSCQSRSRNVDTNEVAEPIPGQVFDQTVPLARWLFHRRELSARRSLMPTPTLLVPTPLALAAGWRKLPRHQDWDFLLRLEALGNVSIVQLEEVLVEFAVGSPSSVSATPNWTSSLDWAADMADQWDNDVYADFLTGQPLRYAIQGRDLHGVSTVLRAMPSRQVPSARAVALAASGIGGRELFNQVLDRVGRDRSPGDRF